MTNKIKNTVSKMTICMTSLSSFIVAQASERFDPFSDISFDDEGVNVGTAITNSEMNYASILDKYKHTLAFLGGIIIITAFCLMVFRFYKLSSSGSNEQERQKATRGILTSSIALMMLGSFSLIVGVLYSAFK